MLNITFAQLELWLSLFLWPFMRVTGMVATAPILSHSSVPMPVKIGICVLLTTIISATLPPLPAVPLMSWHSVAIIIEQLLVGIAIGVVMQVIFAIIQAAGDFIGLQMGLAFASFFSPDSGANTLILSRILYIVALLMFVTVDGHLALIQLLADSFRQVPVAAFSLNFDGFYALVGFTSAIFQLGLLLSLPVLGVLLVINLSMGILNRSAPQFTVFSVGFPISLTVGLVLMAVLMSRVQGVFTALFERGYEFIQVLMLGF
ncbi:flagellar biosynthetic protein FliR [Mangrovimicrobium sediminis]|uniref:Flagellar biosynthetic protein FliR n=1 Tax=Mangrovimicrobium sediminis TaxID=2562682 RepID=A0A4Z0M0E8_9GAMM|nr:flagellar biosynthetic protein FliR [Haliea sp. SAOS-164]TGD73143.1 flagellar biosynthetic protein FliR [Haliea sp. SAOS-164]